jgi:haloalkane dehalogenase
MRKAYVDIPEGQIHYRFDGTGPNLLLLHQTAFSSEEYALMMPILARHCHVTAMDTMGYGMSDPPPRIFEIEDYARTVKEFLDALGMKRVSIAGHHTGSSIAVGVASAYPEVVDKLILSGCPYYDPEVRKARLTDKRYEPMNIAEDGAHLMRAWNMLRTHMPHAGPRGWHSFVTASLMAGPRGEEGHQAVFRYDIEPRLGMVRAPTLLIYGTEDTFISRVEPTQAKMPGSKVFLVEGAGPMIAIEQPEKFAGAILDFMGLT